MEESQLKRALRFLHDTGSVLFYDEDSEDVLDSPKHSSTVRNLVVLQPAWIIDAAKYIIHEREDKELKDVIRVLESNIRKDSYMHEYYQTFKTTGILKKELLFAHLWNHFPCGDRNLLLQLFQEFKLLRPLDGDEFFVPSMLPKEELPEKYVKGDSKWWLPSFVEEASNFSHDNFIRQASGAGKKFNGRPAVLRRVYTVLGRLPFSFMPELQFALSEIKVGEQENFCPENRSLAGIVLSKTYKIETGEVSGVVKEYVIVSTQSSSELEKNAIAEIRVLALVKMDPDFDSEEGMTDWRLFKQVRNKISEVVESMVNLSIRERAVYVNSDGLKSDLEVTKMVGDYVQFKFNGKTEGVPSDLVIPPEQLQKICIRNIGAAAGAGVSGRVGIWNKVLRVFESALEWRNRT